MNPQENAPIDAHAHIVPPTLIDEARKSGRSLGVSVEDTPRGPALQFEGLVPLRPVSGSLAQVEPRVEWMKKQGIGMQFVGSWLDVQGYTLKPQQAATWARLFNEHLAQTVDQHNDRFRGLATVPVQDGTLAAKELEYAIQRLGLSGAMIATDPVDQDLAKESFDPLWAAAEDLDVPIVLHPPTHGFGASVKPDYLAYSVGRTIDTTITTIKLILTGVFDRHPKLKMVLVHGGGFLPYQATRIDHGYQGGQARAVQLQRSKPSDYLPMLYYDTVSMSPESIRFLRDIAGAEHVMLGSDYVFSGTEERLVEPVEHAGLSSSEVACICCTTATQLFLKRS